MKRFLYRSCLSCLNSFSLLLLAGCGFHLMRLDQMPYEKVYVQAPYTSAGEDLRRYIARYAQVVNDPAQAEVILTLVRSEELRSVGGTVNPFLTTAKPGSPTTSLPGNVPPSPFAPQTTTPLPGVASNVTGGLASVGYAANIILTSNMEYTLKRPTGEVLIAPTTLSESRSIVNDESRVLAKYREGDDNLKIMRQALFQSMLLQINRIHLNRQKGSVPTTTKAPTSDINPNGPNDATAMPPAITPPETAPAPAANPDP